MFDDLTHLADDPEQLLSELSKQLVAQGRFHDLFDVRLLEARRRLALPLCSSKQLDDLEEPLRSRLEDAYLAACREVGQLLLDAGRIHDAWMYLRPAGEKRLLRNALAFAVPEDDSVDELIQLALLERVDVERGYAWALGHYGTCQAITMLDNIAVRLSLPEQRACAAILLRHLHKELLDAVREHITREEDKPPTGEWLSNLIDGRPWLISNGGYHVDPSHLAAVVRYSRLLEAPELVRLALDLADYGRRLDPDLQATGDAPFIDFFPNHSLFFSASLGQCVDEALTYFADQAEASSTDDTAAIETYLILLARTGKYGEALEAYGRLVPRDVSLSVQAPSLIDLARKSGDWERYFQLMHDRNDPVGYVVGRLEALETRSKKSAATSGSAEQSTAK